jgi:hypothetical protein
MVGAFCSMTGCKNFLGGASNSTGLLKLESLSLSTSGDLATIIGTSYNYTLASALPTAELYAVEPALPSGLTLNSSTGAISGTPTSRQVLTKYTITAKNSKGFLASGTFDLSVSGWNQEAYIKAPNADANDQFGAAAAIDGDTAVVGARFESSAQTTITNGATASSDNSVSSAGAVYIFRRTGTTWVPEAYLKAPNAEANDFFGASVAIQGDTAVVSASGEDSNETTITNGTTASADNSALESGAVYIFRRTGSTWAHEAYFKAPNTEANDAFGSAISIHGDTVVVGASGEDSNDTTITNGPTASGDNSSGEAGAAYVFRRTGTSWAQEAFLKAANANASDSFGYSVAVSGDTVVVGAPNEDSNDTTITNGASASSDNSSGETGAVYIFKRTGTTWAEEAFLKASNSQANDGFGSATAIDADTVAVSAPNEDSNQSTITNGGGASSNNSALNSGAVYIFKRTGTNWAQESYLKTPFPDANDQLGSTALSVSGNILVAGSSGEGSNQQTITHGPSASSDNSLANAGAAYIFRRTDSTWVHEAYLKAPNAVAGQLFGKATSVTGSTVLVGASAEESSQTTITNGTTASTDQSSPQSGAVYIFRLSTN